VWRDAAFVIPESLKFVSPKKGPFGDRRLFRNNAVNSTYSSNGDKIVRFYFPNARICDFRRGSIAFTLSISNLTNATYARVANGVWSIFNRVRLLTGIELEDIREYNFVHNFFWEVMRDPDAGDTSGEVFGWGTQFERNSWGGTPKNYEMPILVGFFQTGVIPLSLFYEQLQLELYIEDPTRCIETDSTTTPVITISAPYFHYEVLELSATVETTIKTMARAKGVCYPFRTLTYYTNSITSTTNNLVIPHSSAAIDCFISLIRDYASLSNMTINDKFLNWGRYTVYQHQLKINNQYYPYEPVNSLDYPASYNQFLRFIGKWRLGGVYGRPASISYDDYEVNRFVIVNSVETFPNEGLVNDMNTDSSGQVVFVMLWMTNIPPPNTNLDTFVQHFRCIKFDEKKLTLM
jgi:hypothetical protein